MKDRKGKSCGFKSSNVLSDKVNGPEGDYSV
jgi:hypothetical protein